eukprot:CAMPEP_0182450816 /NCGR_PEP_ID=MMETSP1172-20130603/43386_1 /TAXON_ID=708627 /ORGANISM="Timspurckia oligopyrenoides, Strain CCMP3278" /LENGTH=525 /DNA_ID=CAMNT_0024648539 /DNA_START=1192 /DNA_END=2769 /DNA_ORIENTATION=-
MADDPINLERDVNETDSEFSDSRTPARPLSHRTSASASLLTKRMEADLHRETLRETYASVCKLFVWKAEPNFASPWQVRPQRQSSGSAFVISGKRLLTNAHVISNASQILIRAYGDSVRYIARVSSVGHDCDLALLEVDDDAFWKNVRELELSGNAHLEDSVTVVGYPTGGDNLSVTQGVISRVDILPYSHSGMRLLCVQIDAAINPGNSGGPALIDSKVVGVAFMGRSNADNIGYIISLTVIRRFLEDVRRNDGDYKGVVVLGFSYQRMENEALREYTKLDQVDEKLLPDGITPSGVLVSQSDPMRPDDDNLFEGDVVLGIDSFDVSNDGTVPFRDRERVNLLFAFGEKYIGDQVKMTILRNGKVEQLKLSVKIPRPLVPSYQYDVKPRYVIWGGLVFLPLSLDYLRHEYGRDYMEKANTSLLEPLTRRFRDFADQEVIVLSQTLASDITVGYEFKRTILETLNGVKIRNLRHLAVLLDECKDDYLIFGLLHGFSVILGREKAERDFEKLLKRHSISSARSSEI